MCECSLEDDEAADGGKKKKRNGIRRKKPRDLCLLVHEPPTTDKSTMLEIRSDSKPVVD